MAIAIDPAVPILVVLPSDKNLPVDKQTIFLMKPLSVREARTIESKFLGGEVDSNKVIDFLSANLVGWENFRNSKGDEIYFDSANPEDNLSYISISVCVELFSAYFEANNLGTVKRKN